VYNDGSPEEDYQAIYDKYPQATIHHAPVNKGVAHAKNWLLTQMYADGYDDLFILEDDIILTSPKAVTQYLRVAKRTGIGHLSFAHHGPMNVGAKIHTDPNGIELYKHAIGAWCLYTREVIEQVGLLDTNFDNAWEHVEYTYRISKAGLTTPFWMFADVKGSKQWLQEQPDAIENSIIRKDDELNKKQVKGLVYWESKDPNFPLKETLRQWEQL
jgi:GT2 family glycosyltransferase